MRGPSESIRETRKPQQAINRHLQVSDLVHLASRTGPQHFFQRQGSGEWKDYLGSEQGASYSILAQS